MVVKGGSMGPGDFQTPGTGLVVMVWQGEQRGGHDQYCWKGWSPGKGENQEPERDTESSSQWSPPSPNKRIIIDRD